MSRQPPSPSLAPPHTSPSSPGRLLLFLHFPFSALHLHQISLITSLPSKPSSLPYLTLPYLISAWSYFTLPYLISVPGREFDGTGCGEIGWEGGERGFGLVVVMVMVRVGTRG